MGTGTDDDADFVGHNSEFVVGSNVKLEKVDDPFTLGDGEHCGPTVGTCTVADARDNDSRRTPSSIVTKLKKVPYNFLGITIHTQFEVKNVRRTQESTTVFKRAAG